MSWCAPGKLIAVIVPAKERNQGGHIRRASYGKGQQAVKLSEHSPPPRCQARGVNLRGSRHFECVLTWTRHLLLSICTQTSRRSKQGKAWPESLDLIRHHPIGTATLENSPTHTAPGAEVNTSDSRPSTSARSTNPRQHAGSQQPCCNPLQETQASFVRPTSPYISSHTDTL